jgi:hypothetical protein
MPSAALATAPLFTPLATGGGGVALDHRIVRGGPRSSRSDLYRYRIDMF